MNLGGTMRNNKFGAPCGEKSEKWKEGGREKENERQRDGKRRKDRQRKREKGLGKTELQYAM
jgi:hypothetical protein